jgi:2-methylcitrate dehydratase PrpD
MLTERLAEFVLSTRSADLPGSVIDAATFACMDTLACALVGTPEPAAAIAYRWVEEQGGRARATLWGRSLRSSVAEAAFANGVAAHAIDFDDALPTLRGHPSTTLVPAAFAVGEDSGASGLDVLAAYAIGLELCGKLGGAIGPGHYLAGWHTTSTIGVLASTAVAARLWKLDASTLRTAWGIAASQSSGLVRNFGSMTKPFHAGHAARCAVQAVWLAKNGYSADPSIFDGKGGFFALYGKGDGDDLDTLPARLGQPWEIFEPGVYVKRWPCCYGNHRPIGGLMALVAEHGIRADEISDIEIGFLPGADAALINTNPQTGLEAKFSIEYVAAALLLDGDVTLASFTDAMVQRPAARDLMKKVRRRPIADAGIYSGLVGYADVMVTTTRGAFSIRVDKTPGSPAWPLTRADREAKFMDCSRFVLGDAGATALLAHMNGLRDAPDLQALSRGSMLPR